MVDLMDLNWRPTNQITPIRTIKLKIIDSIDGIGRTSEKQMRG